MKKLFQLLILSFLPFIVFSQIKLNDNFKVEVGKPYKVLDSPVKIYLEHDNVLWSFKLVKDELNIQKFNTQTLSQETINSYNDFPEDFVIEHVDIFQDKCYLFYSVWDKKAKKEQLFFRELDLQTAKFKEKGKLLFKVDDKVTGQNTGNGKLYGMQVVDKFKFESSYDDQHIMVRYRKKPQTKNDDKNYDVIGFHIYDNAMNELWNEEVRMPYTESKMDNLDYYVNNKGDAFILTRVFTDNSHKMKVTKGRANYRIELLKIVKGNTKIDKNAISLGARIINSIGLYQVNDNNLVLGGYYGKDDARDADGLFVFNIDASGKIINKMTYEFPLSFLNQNATNKEERKNNRKGKDEAEFGNLHMKKIVVSDDGSVTLIGEQAYFKIHINAKRIDVDFYYRDMVISKIDAGGKLLWNKRLPKFQHGRNTGRMDMSFDHFMGNGNHYFLFLDNERNRDLAPDESPKIHQSGAGGWLTAYKVDAETGYVTKSYLLNSREVNDISIYQFNTNRISEISGNEFIFEVYKKQKEDVLIKVDFE